MVCGGAGDVFQSLPLLHGNGLGVRQSAVVIPKVNFLGQRSGDAKFELKFEVDYQVTTN